MTTEQKLEVAKKALEKIQNPIQAIRSELKEGEILSSQALQIAGSVSFLRETAADALSIISQFKPLNYNMSDFKDRLLEEQEQLMLRLERLREFKNSDKFGGINLAQQSLLNVQEAAMSTYLQVLSERIMWANPPGASQG